MQKKLWNLFFLRVTRIRNKKRLQPQHSCWGTDECVLAFSHDAYDRETTFIHG